MAALKSAYCLARRRRLIDCLDQLHLDLAFITDVRDFYYFTGTLVPDDLPVLLIASSDDRWHVVAPDGFSVSEWDDQILYPWNYRGTRNLDPVRELILSARNSNVAKLGKRIGIQEQSLPYVVAEALAANGKSFVAIDQELARLQQRKDPDEVEVIRASIKANLAAYQAAAGVIAPGVSELQVLAAGRRGAIEGAGELVFHNGDYQSGSYNGPARQRPVERGELYIIDAWTRYRGYWTDMARTFVVGAPPTDVQQELFDHIRCVLTEVPKLLRPGAEGQDVYRQLDALIRQHPQLKDSGLIHHGGHCIGLHIHEMPDINLERGGILQPGNVVCVEPGGYFAAARHGVRLENMYLVTESSCEDLCPGPVELTVCGASSSVD